MDKQLTMREQLKQQGFEIRMLQDSLSKRGKTPSNVEKDFNLIFRDLDIQQATMRYKWEGLPDNIDGWQIEQMLYMRGCLVGYFYGGDLYILPFAQVGTPNIYGMPSAVYPVTYNGLSTGGTPVVKDLKLKINKFGVLDESAKACLLYDRIPFYTQNAPAIPRFTLAEKITRLMGDIIARIGINFTNSTVKQVFYVDNEKQKDALASAIENAMETGKPYVIKVRDVTTGGDNKDVFGGVENLHSQELFESLQSLNSIRCMCLGINNQGAFEKKERVISNEMEGDTVQAEIVLNAGLEMRKLFIENMKIVYPEHAEILNKISVKIAYDNEQEELPEEEEEKTEVIENEYNE